MQKIRLVGHESERDRVLTTLQELGVLQISDLTNRSEHAFFRPKTPATSEIETKLADLRYVLDFLARYDTQKKGFIQSFFNLKDLIRPEEIARIAREYDYRAVCQRVRELDQEGIALRAERAHLETRRTELLPWRDLTVPIEKLRATRTTALVLGRVPTEKLSSLQSAVQSQLADRVLLQTASADETSTYLFAFALTDSAEAFVKMLSDHGGERLPDFPEDTRGLPREILAQIERRLSEINERQQQIAQKATALLSEKPKLQALYDYLHNEYLKAQAQARLLGSPNTFVLEGWVRASDGERLAHAIRNNSEAVYLERIDPNPDEVPPVALENRRLFKPAEFLIKLFGLPHRKELDPTPFVLPFFAIFFGIALTDAGYGLALILIFAYLKRRYRHKQGFQPFANLIMLGGFAAVIAGVLTGGFFGPDIVQNVQWLKERVLFDISRPEGLVVFLLFSFALGFIQVFLGNLLELYDKARTGRLWDGLWHEGSWLVFMAGLGIVAGAGVPQLQALREFGVPGLPASWLPAGMTLALAGVFLVLFFSRVAAPQDVGRQLPWLLLTAAAVLWIQRPFGALPVGESLAAVSVLWILLMDHGLSLGSKVRALLGRIGAGLFRLYGATGLLGDVLSYSRIMALGLSTGLIAYSINQLIGMFLQIPGVGAVVFVMLIIPLQAFSLVINALSAFVHAARLHYVEFFTKFYEAGGEAFRPFAQESVYYDIQR
ncbi:MAG: V-type ATP synthase subunit I [Candidatus Bipolaricaulota bacterium]|nr:V-type ATP synthase subunit I [Candidatus Bipolaricaulota bacterium]